MRSGGGLAVFRGLDEVPAGFGPSVATIGVFDGVHRGHRALMRAVIEQARVYEASPTVVTFDRHPLEIIAPGKEPALITTVPQRVRALAELGIEAVLVVRFDDDFRLLGPEEFVRLVLVDALAVRHVVVGADFRFGHDQAGTIETMQELGAGSGFGCTVFALVSEDGEKVSSSMIRRLIASGHVERAGQELGGPFRLEGVVEGGAARGRDLGFPTANLRVPERMVLPGKGVYAGWLTVNGDRHAAAINVGVRPTFGDRTEPLVEAHVLDFDGDLYGEVVEVEFAHRLRDEERFENAAALVKQMADDVARARALLKP